MSRASMDEVLRLVEEAFADAPRPEHFTNHLHCDECLEHDELMRSRDRASLTVEDVGDTWTPLPFLTPEGYRYYMPALIRLALSAEGEAVLDRLVDELGAPIPHENPPPHLPRTALFTPGETRAVLAFLRYVRDEKQEILEQCGTAPKVILGHPQLGTLRIVRKRGFPLHLAVAAAAVVVGLCLASPDVRDTLDDLLFRSRFVAGGEVVAGEHYQVGFGPGFTFSLTPTDHGWCISVLERGTSNDLSRLTIPFHFVPNPRQLDGWHFRNLANTGPNDGGVNAPGAVREFCFWPGAKGLYHPTTEDIRSAREFGRGTLEILDHELTNLAPGRQAAFARISFSVELSWPRGYAP